MIDPKSLRIGNYVNVPKDGQCPFRIDVIEFATNNDGKYGMIYDKSLHPLTWYLKDLSGIPLSEQELIRLGFVYKEGSEHGFNEWAYPGKYNFQIGEFNGEGYLIDAYDSMPPMRYVHQLQNLFQILTGEELTYKVENETIKP